MAKRSDIRYAVTLADDDYTYEAFVDAPSFLTAYNKAKSIHEPLSPCPHTLKVEGIVSTDMEELGDTPWEQTQVDTPEFVEATRKAALFDAFRERVAKMNLNEDALTSDDMLNKAVAQGFADGFEKGKAFMQSPTAEGVGKSGFSPDVSSHDYPAFRINILYDDEFGRVQTGNLTCLVHAPTLPIAVNRIKALLNADKYPNMMIYSAFEAKDTLVF